jgi:hypothetical protein
MSSVGHRDTRSSRHRLKRSQPIGSLPMSEAPPFVVAGPRIDAVRTQASRPHLTSIALIAGTRRRASARQWTATSPSASKFGPGPHSPTTMEARVMPSARRLELLMQPMPPWLRRTFRWLRPSARWVRIPVGFLLVLGGILSILPVLGLWMLPLGLILLAEDISPLRHSTDRLLLWIERRRPHWMGIAS